MTLTTRVIKDILFRGCSSTIYRGKPVFLDDEMCSLLVKYINLLCWQQALLSDVYTWHEAQLLQRDRATRYFSKFVLFHDVWHLEHQKWPSRSFSGI